MNPGLSTACFYPLQTELSLIKVGELGFNSTEIFFNSPSELETNFLKKLLDIKENYNITVNSVHPMASFAETYMLFSTYERRFYDTLEFYKKYFNAANVLGASTVVLHGSRIPEIIPKEEYYEKYSRLIDEGLKQGVSVAHENVVGTMGYSPKNMLDMREAIGEKFNMVLDIKQSIRSGYKPEEFVDVLYDKIVQIHISDHNEQCDCLAPGQGDFDFKTFICNLRARGYRGDFVIELYSHSFNSDEELLISKNFLQQINSSIPKLDR